MRVVLVHALAQSIDPYRNAFGRLWPDCQALNILDETLYVDLGSQTVVSSMLARRLAQLLHYAASCDTAALVFTGSTFGPAIERIAEDLPVPLIRTDEAAAEQAVLRGRRVAILATAARAAPVVAERLGRAYEQANIPLDLVTHHIAGAQPRLLGGDKRGHDAMVAEAATAFAERDVILFAQASMADAREAVPASLRGRILTTPDATVETLSARFAH